MNPKNKTTIIMMFAILIVTLACTTSAISTPQATGTPQTPPTLEGKPQAFATLEQTCAKVTAIETLNLRATANGTVINVLNNGEVVTVADNTDTVWWLVTIDSRAGFAHADYLEIVPCSPSD